MFPELLRLGPISIKTYGFFVAVGFLVGMNYIRRQAKEYNFNPEVVFDLGLYILVTGIAGARIFYVLFNWSFYKDNLLSVFEIWSGGLVLYGGILFSTVFVILYTRIKKLDLWRIADLIAPALFLGIAIGRVGCLSAGCCYGKPTDLIWGITFTNPQSLVAPELLGIKLHPTQIYESIFCFGLFLSAHIFNKDRKTAGKTFFISVMAYSIFRFLIEFLRGDNPETVVAKLHHSQLIAIFVVLISLVILWLLWKKKS